MLYGLLEAPNQGRFWDFDTGNFLALRTHFKPIYDENFELAEVIMACNDTGVAEALENIAISLAALAKAQCCPSIQIGPSGFFGDIIVSVEGVPTQVYGEDPPIGLGPGEFPPNYPDEGTYNADKCRVANGIVDGWISSVNNLSTIGVVNFAGLLAIVGLVVAGVILFPPSAVPILFYALAGTGFSAGLLVALSQGLAQNREEIVCLLYTSESTESVLSVYSDILDTIIAAIPGVGGVGSFLKTIALWFANTETLNQLFSGASAVGYAGADCSGCEEVLASCCEDFSVDLGGWHTEISTQGYEHQGDLNWAMGVATLTPEVNQYNVYGANLVSPALDCPIVTGQDLVFRATNVPSGSVDIYLWITHDGTRTNIATITRPWGLCEAFDLEPYVGEVLQKVELEIVQVPNWSITFTEIGNQCDPCV